jgi:aminomethyltransferase
MTALLLTPLDSLHRELGARMGAFAGYDMPIQYPLGLKGEHLHTRAHAGLFDVSHMGQIRAVGPREALEQVLPIDAHDWPVGKQKYSYLLNEHGGIEDDLMCVRLEDEIRLVVNAGNKINDMALLRKHVPQLKFEWVDNALVALQGPDAQALLERWDPVAATMTFMTGSWLNLNGIRCYATRSGYTGEDGYEISVPADKAIAFAKQLLVDTRTLPVGLGARDTLRLEAGLPLHGNDIGPNRSPIEANLAWAIPKIRRADGARAGGFVGANALMQQWRDGAKEKLIGLKSSSAVPIRAHNGIVNNQGANVGEVTSGTISPSLNQPVLLAYVQSAFLDTPLEAVVRDKHLALEQTKLPFVEKRYKR